MSRVRVSQDWISWVFSICDTTLKPASHQLLLVVAFHADDMGFAQRMTPFEIISIGKIDCSGFELQDLFNELIDKNYLSMDQFGYYLRR
ncbi:TPA: hypothetical protein ACVU5P_004231 [Vibrio parahaemolyticus]